MTFGAHKLVHFEPFLDYTYEIWHCCQRLSGPVARSILDSSTAVTVHLRTWQRGRHSCRTSVQKSWPLGWL